MNWTQIQHKTDEVLTFKWTESVLYRLIMVAGTASGLVLLCSTIWMSFNSSVHPFVLLFMSEDTAKFISYLATTGYIVIPEIIVWSGIVVVIGHVRMWRYAGGKLNTWPFAWMILYGLPTLFFLIISAITVGYSVTSTTYIAPMPMVIARAASGFMYAGVSLLYHFYGKKQESDRLNEKDIFITHLLAKREETLTELTSLKADYDLLEKENISLQKTVYDLTQKVRSSHRENSMQAGSFDYNEWISSEVKTVSIDDIVSYTNHSKQKVKSAVRFGKLDVSTRNRELVLMSSLRRWLVDNPPIKDTDPDITALHLVGE